jgi:uncharacterized protein YoxC
MSKGELSMTQLVLIIIAVAFIVMGLMMLGGFRESIAATLKSILRMGR